MAIPINEDSYSASRINSLQFLSSLGFFLIIEIKDFILLYSLYFVINFLQVLML